MVSSQKEKHSVIIIPGLSNDINKLKLATNSWNKKGFEVHLVPMDWKSEVGNFNDRLGKILVAIDKRSSEGQVSIIGTSAGGSAAFNAFLARSEKVNVAVNVCGRLRSGHHRIRSLERMSSKSPSFRESVLLFQSREDDIPNDLKSRMMTVSAKFGDELVPADTSSLDGAYNIKVPVGEHGISIFLSLTLFSNQIIDFIKRNSVE